MKRYLALREYKTLPPMSIASGDDLEEVRQQAAAWTRQSGGDAVVVEVTVITRIKSLIQIDDNPEE